MINYEVTVSIKNTDTGEVETRVVENWGDNTIDALALVLEVLRDEQHETEAGEGKGE